MHFLLRFFYSYESPGRSKGTWDDLMMNKYNPQNPYVSNGINYYNGLVQEKGSKYRLGAAYVGWGNYRIGIDSDKYIRRSIQNRLAHDIISPQPSFEVLSGRINPYFQYKSRNQFSSW